MRHRVEQGTADLQLALLVALDVDELRVAVEQFAIRVLNPLAPPDRQASSAASARLHRCTE